MNIKEWLKKFKREEKPEERSGDKSADKNYANRFVKFYHLNKERLNKERRSGYDGRREKGICVRCRQKAMPGIVFCEYHQSKQKEYNAKARGKKL